MISLVRTKIRLKLINALTKKTMLEVLPQLDKELTAKMLQRDCVYQYIMEHGTNAQLIELMEGLR